MVISSSSHEFLSFELLDIGAVRARKSKCRIPLHLWNRPATELARRFRQPYML